MRILRWTASALAALALVASPGSAWARTFYVNPSTGINANTMGQAQNPATPWKTVKRALGVADAGDTILVMVPTPGTPMVLTGVEPETIASKRDGAAGAPIAIRCQEAQLCVWTPPAGTNGFFVSHDHHVIDGFKVTGANKGIVFGAHDGGGPLVGGVIQNNLVQGANSNGIDCDSCQGVEIAFNTVRAGGHNGIRYHMGNGSLIHDNIVRNNQQFGIYVEGGSGHQVFANTATGNNGGGTQIQITGGQISQRTFYVSVGGNDAHTEGQAQDPATPWLTIQRGLNTALGGDTVVVRPGTYAGAESRRDGAAGEPITVRSVPPGEAIVQAGAGVNGFVIGHHHHVVDGFTVTGSQNGIQLGPHEVGDAAVDGLQAINNVVHDNRAAGIKFANVQGGGAMHNVVFANGREGIVYGGNSGTIFNNLVYGNATHPVNGVGKYGIALTSGGGHTIASNTVHANLGGGTGGGLRLGTATLVPVFSTVKDNIVTGHPIGVKEPGGAGYTGFAAIDFNNVNDNGVSYELGPSQQGPNSFSFAAGYLNAGAFDFRLRKTSQCVDKGSVSPADAGLASRTAFADKSPDEGTRVDLGFHGTLLTLSAGTLSNLSVQMTFAGAGGGDTLTLQGRLTPGAGSDGIGLGTEFVRVTAGSHTFDLNVSGFSCQGGGTSCTFNGPGPTTGTFNKSGANVDFQVTASGATLSHPGGPVPIGIRIGDDTGSFNAGLHGTLVYP